MSSALSMIKNLFVPSGPAHVFNLFYNVNHRIGETEKESLKNQSFRARVVATFRTLYGFPQLTRDRSNSAEASRSGALDYLTVIPVIYKTLEHAAMFAPNKVAKGFAIAGRALLWWPNLFIAIGNFFIAAALTLALLPIIGLVHFGQFLKNKWDARQAVRYSEFNEPPLHPEVSAENEQSCCGGLRRVLQKKATAGERSEQLSSSLVEDEVVYSGPTSASYQGAGQPQFGQPAARSDIQYSSPVPR